MGEPGVGAGEGCEGTEVRGGAAHPGFGRIRAGPEPRPGGAQRAQPATPGAAQ